MATRWGIVSAGQISHDFATVLSTLPASEHQVIAVAARQLSRSQDFAKLYGIRKAYGSYQELADDKDIEIVYIAALNPQHSEVAKMMLNSGKHVLCEKPMTMNLKQTTELINLAKSKNLFLMEALWSRFFPSYAVIKREIDSGSIGELKQAILTIGFCKTDVDRLNQKSLGGGTILDLGVYALQFAIFIFNGEKPISVKASGHLNEEGVDQSVSASLIYKNGRTATIVTHSLVDLPNEAHLVGTKGTIRVPKFWKATEVFLPTGVVENPLPEAPGPLYYSSSMGLKYEIEEVRKYLQAGLKESSKAPHRESLMIAELQDELRRQLGVVYPADE